MVCGQEGRSFEKASAPIFPAAQDLFLKLAVEPVQILDFYQPLAISIKRHVVEVNFTPREFLQRALIFLAGIFFTP